MDLVTPPSVTLPVWLLQLTGADARLSSDALTLLAIANYPIHGAGALKVFEGMALCLEAWHDKTGDEAAAQWARATRRLVAGGHRLTGQFAHVSTPTAREHDRPVWGVFLRLADLSRSDRGLHNGAASLGGLLLLAQLQRTRAQHEEVATFKPLATKAAARLAACAQASATGSASETAIAWLSLSKASEFTASSFAQAANATKVGEVKHFASTLANALTRLSRTEVPGSQQPIVPGNGKPEGSSPTTMQPQQKRPRKERPSAAGLMKTASFATLAEAFGVYRYWHWLSPDELKPVVGKLVAALQAEDDGTDAADFSLIALVGLVMSHDHSVTLKLSLKQNDDIWFCPRLGCAFVDRGVLLELTGPRGSHGYVLVVFPALVVAAIRHRLKARPDAEVLGDLMRTAPDEAWLSAAEHFTIQLGDPSHPPKSARLSHSLGLVYLETGAPPVVAAHQSLNWCLCADSAGHYYGISAEAANAAAGKVFARLGLGAPEGLPEGLVSGRPDIPGDDDIRGAWAKAGAPVLNALQCLPMETSVQNCLDLFNAAMVACWRALPLVDAGRPLRPDRPSLTDCLMHPRWYRRDDKKVRENGARLLLRTRQAADVMGAAVALRELLISRLSALGISEARLPRTLVDAKPAASLFVEVDWKSDGSARLVARRFSDELLKDHPQPWSGLFNIGRVFWLCESAAADETWSEQLLSGHGRGMASVESIALSQPVMDLMNGVVPLVERTLQRLDLPRFAGGLHAVAQVQPVKLDLRSIDRRSTMATRPSDIPTHHVDCDTLPSLVIVDACHAELGRAPGMPPAARVLMALICASGLIHSQDVAPAWDALTSQTTNVDAPWHEWPRASGQRIRMPKLPQTWIAADLCAEWPALPVAEAELRAWLVDRFPGVQWPAREGATIVALCYLAARWIRLHVPPFLVDAYRPERLSGTFDAHSNARLCSADAREALAPMDLPRPRLVLRKKEPPAGTHLQQIVAILGLRIKRNLKLGGYEKRARRIGAVLKGRFDADDTSPVAAMVVAWLLQEAGHWNPRAPKRDAPSTWVEYLRRMLPVLERFEKEGRDPASFTPEDWKALGAAVVNTDDVEDPTQWPRVRTERHNALARMAVLLARDARYPDALWAVATKDAAGTPARYRPAKASALVMCHDIEACAWLLQLMQADWPLDALLLEAQLRITWEACARADEANAMAVTDVSLDGTQTAFRPHNFIHLKREWNHRTNGLGAKTKAVVLAVRACLAKLPARRAFLFSQDGSRIDLRLGRAMQANLIAMLRAITGNEHLAWHGLRGGGLQQRLAADWETHLMRYLSGPLQLRHARALMDGLKGDGVHHFAAALGCSGHLSPGVPIRHYLTAWPYWYACAMRTALTHVPVSPDLADALPGANRALLATANHRHRTDGDIDDWAWAVKRLHHPGWRKDRDPLRHLAPPRLASAQDDRTVPVINQTRYLLLRTLQLDTVTAAGVARIAHPRALRLEPMGTLLRRFDEVHQPADGLPASAVVCASTVRLLHRTLGDALFKWIVHAPAPVHDVLGQWLEGKGPMPNADRVQCLLQALPTELGLSFGWAAGVERAALAGECDPTRIRSGPSSGHTGDMPRVRIFCVPPIEPIPIGDQPRTNDHTTAILTALARLTLQIRPHLQQKERMS